GETSMGEPEVGTENLLRLEEEKRILYLRGLLPFPLRYKGLLGEREAPEARQLAELAAEKAGLIVESADSYPVFVSDASPIPLLYRELGARLGLTPSQRASLTLEAFAYTHSSVSGDVIRSEKASRLARARGKVDLGRPGLPVRLDECFMQAAVGSLLQAVLHMPSLYKGIDEKLVSSRVIGYISSRAGIDKSRAGNVLNKGIRDLDRVSGVLLGRCRS
ncbi:MAG: hypothetical protein LRS47_00390, partial [Desulfurococcales archaeon]|nr:hypothetical protein [Desulfurococcales archaeon]